jgi:hypothetical protein
VDGAPTEEPRPDVNNARSQRPAPEGNWRVSCSCLLCWNTRGCPQIFQHVSRSSILCGCINKFLYRQANAVWKRHLHARRAKGQAPVEQAHPTTPDFLLHAPLVLPHALPHSLPHPLPPSLPPPPHCNHQGPAACLVRAASKHVSTGPCGLLLASCNSMQ